MKSLSVLFPELGPNQLKLLQRVIAEACLVEGRNISSSGLGDLPSWGEHNLHQRIKKRQGFNLANELTKAGLDTLLGGGA